ncbi:MFS transporter [Anaerococcus murdochii]|uniref:MFS transporter n=1 Tax=Anaerococcus murdochii TaxID=411577 RepID=A0ABS7SYG9_9FIRM|nr:MFS transporter [Anaerococcus murdochii]MBZ2386574.1 MFS transporter [Anaerococcus murdochii]
MYLVENKKFQWPIFILMASVTFMAILSELVPSGILPELMTGLGISEAQAGTLVGFYAIASAIFAIPLISATVEFSRKKLLICLLIGFALSNVLVGFAPSYILAIVGRVIGGICAGVLWPMIAAYGMKLVDDEHKGLAVAVIMSGTTFGMSLGLPLVTLVGTNVGWRIEFLVIAILIILIALGSHFMLPEVSGEKRVRANSPLTLIKNKGVLIIILLTFISVLTNYGVYTYITNLVDSINYSGGIGFAQVLFGIGSILSVLIAGKIIDKHIKILCLLMLASSLLAFIFFGSLSSISFMVHLGFILWGIGFGALVTLYQTAVARQVPSNASAVATSLQSASFNFSIMIASSLGGAILASGNINNLLFLMAAILGIGLLVTILSKKTLA